MLYSITGPDGKTYQIDGPPGATREQVIAKIKERLATTPAVPLTPAVPTTQVAKTFYDQSTGMALEGPDMTGEDTEGTAPPAFQGPKQPKMSAREKRAQHEYLMRTDPAYRERWLGEQLGVGSMKDLQREAAATLAGARQEEPIDEPGYISSLLRGLGYGTGEIARGAGRYSAGTAIVPGMQFIPGGAANILSMGAAASGDPGLAHVPGAVEAGKQEIEAIPEALQQALTNAPPSEDLGPQVVEGVATIAPQLPLFAVGGTAATEAGLGKIAAGGVTFGGAAVLKGDGPKKLLKEFLVGMGFGAGGRLSDAVVESVAKKIGLEGLTKEALRVAGSSAMGGAGMTAVASAEEDKAPTAKDFLRDQIISAVLHSHSAMKVLSESETAFEKRKREGEERLAKRRTEVDEIVRENAPHNRLPGYEIQPGQSARFVQTDIDGKRTMERGTVLGRSVSVRLPDGRTTPDLVLLRDANGEVRSAFAEDVIPTSEGPVRAENVETPLALYEKEQRITTPTTEERLAATNRRGVVREATQGGEEARLEMERREPPEPSPQRERGPLPPPEQIAEVVSADTHTREMIARMQGEGKSLTEIAESPEVKVTTGLMRSDETDTSARKMAVESVAVDGLIDYTKKNGGGTFDPDTLHPVERTEGYQIALHPDEFDVKPIDLDKVTAKSLTEQLDKLKGKADNIGTWIDDGKLYFEPSVYVKDRAEAETLGKKNNQKAIWDWAAKDVIPTGGTGEKSTITLTHYSDRPGLTELVPEKAGTGPLRGAERKRGAKLVYMGTEGYVPERGLGTKHRYTTEMPESSIYDIGKDPQGFRERSGPDIDRLEALLKDAGYKGYRNTEASQPNTVALFGTTPVKEVVSNEPSKPSVRSEAVPGEEGPAVRPEQPVGEGTHGGPEPSALRSSTDSWLDQAVGRGSVSREAAGPLREALASLPDAARNLIEDRLAAGSLDIVTHKKGETLPADIQALVKQASSPGVDFTITNNKTGKSVAYLSEPVTVETLRHEMTHGIERNVGSQDVKTFLDETVAHGRALLNMARAVVEGRAPSQIEMRMSAETAVRLVGLQDAVREAQRLGGEKGVKDLAEALLSRPGSLGEDLSAFAGSNAKGKDAAQYHMMAALRAAAEDAGVTLTGSYHVSEPLAYRSGADADFFGRLAERTRQVRAEGGEEIKFQITPEESRELETDSPKDVRKKWYRGNFNPDETERLPAPWKKLTTHPAETVRAVDSLRLLAAHTDKPLGWDRPASTLAKALAKVWSPEVKRRQAELDPHESGSDFYGDFRETFLPELAKRHGGLSPAQERLAAMATAISSNQTTVMKNGGDAAHAINEFMATGKFPLEGPYLGTSSKIGGPESRFGWGGVGDNIISEGMYRLNGLIEHFGSPEAAADWLYSKHSPQEIRTVARELVEKNLWSKRETAGRGFRPSINGKQVIDPGQTANYGSVIFGPKVGRFAPNLMGFGDTPTIDRHIAAFATVTLGQRDFPTRVDPVTGQIAHDIEVTPAMRAAVDGALRDIAAEHGLSVADTQAIVWANWKELWDKAGSTRDVKVKYGDTLDEVRRINREAPGAEGRPTERVLRSDAGAVGGGERGTARVPEQAEIKFKLSQEAEDALENIHGARVREAKPEPLQDRVRAKLKRTKQYFTSEYPDLPRGAQWEPIRFELKSLGKQRDVVSDKTMNYMKDISRGLARPELETFADYAVMKDVVEDAAVHADKIRERVAAGNIEALHPEEHAYRYPFGLDKDTAQEILGNLEAQVQANPKLKAAVEKREKMWEEVKREYVKATDEVGFNMSDRLRRQDYFRRQVLDYLNAKEIARGRGGIGSRSFLKERKGSGKDFNTQYAEAEYEVIQQMLFDTERAKMYKVIRDNYDISPQLRAEAGGADWRTTLPEGYEILSPRLLGPIPEEYAKIMLEDALLAAGVDRKNIDRALSKAGYAAQDMAVPTEVAATLRYLQQSKTSNPILRTLAAAQKAWKVWRLFSPFSFFKYTMRNMTGDTDKTIVGNTDAVKQAPASAKLAFDYLTKGDKGADPADLQHYLDRGGIQTGLAMNELSDLRRLGNLPQFYPERTTLQKVTGAPGEAVRNYWKGVRATDSMREMVLRYANYKNYLNQMRKNPDGRPDNFGASVEAEVMALDNIRDRAFKLSNDLVGPYDSVSAVGQVVRDYLIPFWSFQEVNMRSYYRLAANAASDRQVAAAVGAKILGVAARRSPIIAARVGVFALKAAALSAALGTWNQTMFPDEEAELPDSVRFRPHITLGRDSDGKVMYFSRVGALSDLLEWVGLDTPREYLQDYLSGRHSLKDIAKEMAKSPTNKVVGGVAPTYKVPTEVLYGASLYPDWTKPRPIRERNTMRGMGRYVAEQLGQTETQAFEKMAGYPTRKFDPSTFFIYKADPEETAYRDISNDKYAFMRDKGKNSAGAEPTPKGNALYYLKMSMKMQDPEAVAKFRQEYFRNGGTVEGFKKALNALHPLYGLNKQEQAEFISTMSDGDREKLKRAMKFYYETLGGKQGLAKTEEEIDQDEADQIMDQVEEPIPEELTPEEPEPAPVEVPNE